VNEDVFQEILSPVKSMRRKEIPVPFQVIDKAAKKI